MISLAGIDASLLVWVWGRAPLNRDFCPLSDDDSEDLVFADDHVLDVFDPDLGAGVLADEDPIASFHLECDPFSTVVQTANSDGDDPRLHWLLLGCVGDDDAALGRLLGLHPLDQHAVVQRL